MASSELRKRGFRVEPFTKDCPQLSIPLILPNDFLYNPEKGSVLDVVGERRRQLNLIEKAAELIGGIEGPVCVMAVCGEPMTGKAYVVSRLLGSSKAFTVSAEFMVQTTKPCGAWLATSVLKSDDVTVVLLHVNLDFEDDAGLLLSILLISSVVVYNTLGVPSKTDLNKLKFLTTLAENLSIQEGQVVADLKEFRSHMPDFIWLCRDVDKKLILPSTKEELSASDYILRVVCGRDTAEDELTEEDRTAEALVSAFCSVDAFCLPCPGPEDVVENIAKHADKISPKFTKELDKFLDVMAQKIRPIYGYADGSALSGRHLIELFRVYLDSVNHPKNVPSLSSAWSLTMIMMKLKIVDNIVAFYNEKMQTLYETASKKKGKESPLEEFSDEDKKRDTLMELHRQAVDKALKEMYRRMAGFGCLEERDRTEYIATVPKMLDKLVKLEDETLMSKDRDGKPVRHSGPLLVGGELLKFRKQNLESSQRVCEKIAEKLFKEVRDDAMKYLYDYSMEKLCKKLDGARKDYISKARGPAKYEVLRNKLQSPDMEEFIDKLKAMKLFREAVIRGHIEQEDEHLKNEQSRQKVHEIAEHMDRIKWEKERVVELTGKYYNKLTQMIKEGPDIREQRDRNKTKQFMKAGMLKQARDLEEIMKQEAAAVNPAEQCQWLSKEAEEARKIEQKLITIQKEKISMLKNGAIPKRKDCVIM